jgi:hypothetical protein
MTPLHNRSIYCQEITLDNKGLFLWWKINTTKKGVLTEYEHIGLMSLDGKYTQLFTQQDLLYFNTIQPDEMKNLPRRVQFEWQKQKTSSNSVCFHNKHAYSAILNYHTQHAHQMCRYLDAKQTRDKNDTWVEYQIHTQLPIPHQVGWTSWEEIYTQMYKKNNTTRSYSPKEKDDENSQQKDCFATALVKPMLGYHFLSTHFLPKEVVAQHITFKQLQLTFGLLFHTYTNIQTIIIK